MMWREQHTWCFLVYSDTSCGVFISL